MVKAILFQISWIFAICVNFGIVSSTTQESRLHIDLIERSGYYKYARPVKSIKDAVVVRFGLSLQQINSLDAESELLHTHCWLNYEWTDFGLRWNESQYGGLWSIRVNIDDIWTPDISPFNGQRFDYGILKQQTAVVYSSGKVSWVPPILLSTSCSMDLWKFPYDQHYCKLKFGSWTYDGSKVNLTSKYDKIDISTYQPNPIYELVEYTAKRHVAKYDCCPEAYIDVTFSIHLKRRTSYASHLYVSPAICMAIMIPVMFILPPESKEKIIYGIGLMITNSILFMSMVDGLPVSGHLTVPLIAVYHITNMVLIAISLAISALVMNVWSKGERTKSLPRFLNTIVVYPLSKILCVSKGDFVAQNTGDHQRLDGKSDVSETQSTGQNDVLAAEWRQLATIIDRLCFLIFVIVVFLCIIVFGSK